MTIPNKCGVSTHFELLARSLDTAGMLAGRIVGQDCAPSKIRKALCALRAFGAKDARRVELLREMAHLLGRSIDGCLASPSADLVHCHDALATYAAVNAPAVKERGLPVVQTVHGPWSRETLTSGVSADSLFYRELRRIEEAAYASRARFIAVDRGQADILIDDFGVPREKVSVIHNAVDCAEIRALALSRPENSLPQPYFVVPRRLVPKNGVHVAIEALKLLADRKVHLAIAGEGPLAASLRDKAEDAGVSRRVHFLGHLSREQLMPLMASAAGVIVPSVPCEGVIEATSLAVIESFACGVPVIASNIGGLAELIQHGSTGLLFPAGDAHSLSGNVLRLLEMPGSERIQLCAAARDAALARWDVRPWFIRVSEAYDMALHACPTTR
jgi:glycosyltransferase involved in cell wall biosynthesis